MCVCALVFKHICSHAYVYVRVGPIVWHFIKKGTDKLIYPCSVSWILYTHFLILVLLFLQQLKCSSGFIFYKKWHSNKFLLMDKILGKMVTFSNRSIIFLFKLAEKFYFLSKKEEINKTTIAQNFPLNHFACYSNLCWNTRLTLRFTAIRFWCDYEYLHKKIKKDR